MVSNNFSDVLNALANVPNDDIKVQAHWSLMNKKQQKVEFKKAVQKNSQIMVITHFLTIY